MQKLSKALKNYIVDSVVMIVLGIIMMIWAKNSVQRIFQILGFGLIILGVLKWILYFIKKDPAERKFVDLIIGLVIIAAGIILFVRADPLTAYFPAIAGILLAYGAVLIICWAIELRMGPLSRFLNALILGIISLIFSVIVFVHPVFLLNVMIQTTGAGMFFEGIALLIVMIICRAKE